MARKSRQFQVPPADLVETLDGFAAGRQSLAEVRDRLRRTLAADPQQSLLLTLCVERARDEGRLGLAAAEALLVLATGTASEDIPTAGPEAAASGQPSVLAAGLGATGADGGVPPAGQRPPPGAAPATGAPVPVAPGSPAPGAVPDPPAPRATGLETPAAAPRRARGSPRAGSDAPAAAPAPPAVATARAPARHQAGLRPGAVLKDRYVLGERLGGGGMAEIFKALDRRREQAGTRPSWVALKIVAAADDQSPPAEALKREATLAGRLDHPNLVKVLGIDRDGHHLFLAMELLAGESLARRLDERQPRPMSRVQVLPLIEELCRGLAYLHGRGLVHGDIKPGNLFITEDERLKILDFGIARDLKLPAPVTPRGRTAEYASCEVLAGEPPVPADDVYATACVTYRMLAGHRPFGNQTALEAAAAGRRPGRIETLPAPQWQALDRALAFRRADRPADIGQFISLLKGLRDEPEPTPQAPVARTAAPAAAAADRAGTRWPFAGTWAAFAAVCVIGAVLAWVAPDQLPRPKGRANQGGLRDQPRDRAQAAPVVPPAPAVVSPPVGASEPAPLETGATAAPPPASAPASPPASPPPGALPDEG
jgi:hypothetical protein